MLDLGAERARFLRRGAQGFSDLGSVRFSVPAMLSGRILDVPLRPVAAVTDVPRAIALSRYIPFDEKQCRFEDVPEAFYPINLAALPPTLTEQFRFEKVLGDRPAIDRHEGTLGPGATISSSAGRPGSTTVRAAASASMPSR